MSQFIPETMNSLWIPQTMDVPTKDFHDNIQILQEL